MNNFTVFLLHISSKTTSPFISMPEMKRSGSLSIYFSRANKLSSSFLVSHSLSDNRVLGCSFSNILETALRFSGDFLVNKEFSQRYHCYKNNPFTSIVETAFSNCFSHNSNGGGVYFDGMNRVVQLDRCSFFNCTTRKAGGAIYGMFSHLNISRTCFFGCQANNHAHAAMINLCESQDDCFSSQNSFVSCSSADKLYGKSSIFAIVGHHYYQVCNFSHNCARSLSSLFGTFVAEIFQVSFSDMRNSSGPHLMRHYHTCICIFSFNNILKNHAAVSLMEIDNKTVFAHTTIVQNYFINPFTGSILQLRFINCYLDDPKFFVVQKNITLNNVINGSENDLIPFRFIHGEVCNIVPNNPDDFGFVNQLISVIDSNSSEFFSANPPFLGIKYPSKETPIAIPEAKPIENEKSTYVETALPEITSLLEATTSESTIPSEKIIEPEPPLQTAEIELPKESLISQDQASSSISSEIPTQIIKIKPIEKLGKKQSKKKQTVQVLSRTPSLFDIEENERDNEYVITPEAKIPQIEEPEPMPDKEFRNKSPKVQPKRGKTLNPKLAQKKIKKTKTPNVRHISPSQTFANTMTFEPSMIFTSSVSPSQSLIPLLLYSAAGLIVVMVLLSIYLLRSGESGYNLMTPSESADSKMSDMTLSSTTAVTGDSESIIV